MMQLVRGKRLAYQLSDDNYQQLRVVSGCLPGAVVVGTL
jgi:hypothetical protein